METPSFNTIWLLTSLSSIQTDHLSIGQSSTTSIANIGDIILVAPGGISKTFLLNLILATV